MAVVDASDPIGGTARISGGGTCIDRLLADSPHITSAPDWTTLAARIGVDAARLEETMREHNGARRPGRVLDPEFGRPLTGLKPIDEPSYYAMQFFAAARKNLGGVRTGENCQVLRTLGRPVPGLFAAGEVAGMAGGRINGYSAREGTMLGPSLYSGRVTGLVLSRGPCYRLLTNFASDWPADLRPFSRCWPKWAAPSGLVSRYHTTNTTISQPTIFFVGMEGSFSIACGCSRARLGDRWRPEASVPVQVKLCTCRWPIARISPRGAANLPWRSSRAPHRWTLPRRARSQRP